MGASEILGIQTKPTRIYMSSQEGQDFVFFADTVYIYIYAKSQESTTKKQQPQKQRKIKGTTERETKQNKHQQPEINNPLGFV